MTPEADHVATELTLQMFNAKLQTFEHLQSQMMSQMAITAGERSHQVLRLSLAQQPATEVPQCSNMAHAEEFTICCHGLIAFMSRTVALTTPQPAGKKTSPASKPREHIYCANIFFL